MRLKLTLPLTIKSKPELSRQRHLFVLSSKIEPTYRVKNLIKDIVAKFDLTKKLSKVRLELDGYELGDEDLVLECLNDMDAVSLSYRTKIQEPSSSPEPIKDFEKPKTKKKNNDEIRDKEVKLKSKSKEDKKDTKALKSGSETVARQLKKPKLISLPENNKSKSDAKKLEVKPSNGAEKDGQKELTKTQKRNMRRAQALKFKVSKELGLEQPSAQPNSQVAKPTHQPEQQETAPAAKKATIKVTRFNVDDVETSNDRKKNKRGFNYENEPEEPTIEVKDYTILPDLNLSSLPPHSGMTIAFKTMEMSADYNPIISDFKEAKVIDFNPTTEELTYELINIPPPAQPQYDENGELLLGRFELPPTDIEPLEAEIEGPVQVQPEIVPFGYLIEPKKLSSD